MIYFLNCFSLHYFLAFLERLEAGEGGGLLSQLLEDQPSFVCETHLGMSKQKAREWPDPVLDTGSPLSARTRGLAGAAGRMEARWQLWGAGLCAQLAQVLNRPSLPHAGNKSRAQLKQYQPFLVFRQLEYQKPVRSQCQWLSAGKEAEGL